MNCNVCTNEKKTRAFCHVAFYNVQIEPKSSTHKQTHSARMHARSNKDQVHTKCLACSRAWIKGCTIMIWIRNFHFGTEQFSAHSNFRSKNGKWSTSVCVKGIPFLFTLINHLMVVVVCACKNQSQNQTKSRHYPFIRTNATYEIHMQPHYIVFKLICILNLTHAIITATATTPKIFQTVSEI